MKNILAGIDFHENTQLIVDKTLELAKLYKANVWLLHAAAPEPDFVGYSVGPEYIRDFRARELKDEHKLLTKYVDQLKNAGLETDGLLIQGNTIDVVLEESEKLAIDLIIFGHHEHSLLYQWFFGSNAAELIRKTEIPVLVVPLK